MALSVLPFLVIHLLLACSVKGQERYPSYNFGSDVAGNILAQEKVMAPFVLGSLGLVNGSLPARQEIRELQKNPDQWTLYILGLDVLQFINQSNPLSWYGISGIHGLPYESWGGVEAVPGSENIGYCTHTSTLFPVWHRPYVALFENILYNLIQRIVQFWPEGEVRQRYQTAANTFRIPYWDWAAHPPAGEPVLPSSISGSSFVDIDGPSGVQRIANPLFTYQFKPLEPSAFVVAPWDEWEFTVRAPTTANALARSNNTDVSAAIDRIFPSFQQRLYNLFSNYHNYTIFSHDAVTDDSDSSFDSVESLHDSVHTYAGGFRGHMAFVPYSAFDPVFFLHHANVDRILALWQVLNPDSWVTPVRSTARSYTISVGQVLDESTPLTPFFSNKDGMFWDSSGVRDPLVFGYTYAEIDGASLKGGPMDSAVRSRVVSTINRLYSSFSPASFRRSLEERGIAGGDFGGLHSHWFHGAGDAAALRRFVKSIVTRKVYMEWIANIRVNKTALDGPFTIFFFVGSQPSNPNLWSTAPNLVGTMSIFTSPGQFGMADMQQRSTGTVPLTAGLVERAAAGEIASLEPDVVLPYLRENLRFTVLNANGTAFDPKGVDGLHVVLGYRRKAPSQKEAKKKTLFPVYKATFPRCASSSTTNSSVRGASAS
ncbi:hypothetical protein VTK73DRAFT_3260 [Phialemonium thermophilum]|uniref:Tyrosinase copper-binding domain-containing protein n=1 Tax=Phialemonium thermophilum TaxID=223376 RepID=A0ABR3Y8K5_9PEZI